MNKLHICVIGSGYDVHTRNRTKIFADMGHQVTLVTDLPGNMSNVAEVLLQLPKQRILEQSVGIWQFVSAIRKIDADIYFVHFPRRHSGWAAAIANVHPLIVMVMGGDVNFDERETSTSGFQRHLTDAVLNKADVVLSQTHHLTRIMVEQGILASKIQRVIWGIDLNHWYRRSEDQLNALRQRWNVGATDRILFSPKMLLPFYNIHIIVEAMPMIVAQHPNAKLLVAERRPDPAYKSQLFSQINELGIQSHIIFVGEIPHDEIALYYSISDAVVTLASSDGLPHAMLEAMACETPYILGDLDVYQEFVRNEEHVCFADFTPTSVANTVNALLADAELHQRIVRNGKQLVHEIADIHQEAHRVEAIMYDLVDKTPDREKPIDYALAWQAVRLGIAQLSTKARNLSSQCFLFSAQ